jgi:hypothetical protein
MLDFDKRKRSDQFRYPINSLACRLELLFYTEFHLVAAEDLVFCITLVTNPVDMYPSYCAGLLAWFIKITV